MKRRKEMKRKLMRAVSKDKVQKELETDINCKQNSANSNSVTE